MMFFLREYFIQSHHVTKFIVIMINPSRYFVITVTNYDNRKRKEMMLLNSLLETYAANVK
jgi:hypothetical protein